MVALRKIGLYLTVTVTAVTTVALISLNIATAYNCKEGDTDCWNAKNNMEQKQREARSATIKANSVSELISQINSEIESIEAEIAFNEIEITDLNNQIDVTVAKLELQQNALARLLVEMHFSGGNEPIRILAGTNSISDLAEKQAREEVVKKEIATVSEEVKTTKKELEDKKQAVETKLESNKVSRELANQKRAEQIAIMDRYRAEANDAQILADRWEETLKQLAYTPPSNTVGWGSRSWNGINTYDDRYNCPQHNMDWYPNYGGSVCQCTGYVSYKAYEKWGIINDWRGDAWEYIYAGDRSNNYSSAGVKPYVNNIAEANTIAVQQRSNDAPYGHVMWVESVNGDGTINITEYNVNWPAAGCYIGDFCSRKNVGTKGMLFVHFSK